jgi:hypothetical protein
MPFTRPAALSYSASRNKSRVGVATDIGLMSAARSVLPATPPKQFLIIAQVQRYDEKTGAVNPVLLADMDVTSLSTVTAKADQEVHGDVVRLFSCKELPLSIRTVAMLDKSPEELAEFVVSQIAIEYSKATVIATEADWNALRQHIRRTMHRSPGIIQQVVQLNEVLLARLWPIASGDDEGGGPVEESEAVSAERLNNIARDLRDMWALACDRAFHGLLLRFCFDTVCRSSRLFWLPARCTSYTLHIMSCLSSQPESLHAVARAMMGQDNAGPRAGSAAALQAALLESPVSKGRAAAIDDDEPPEHVLSTTAPLLLTCRAVHAYPELADGRTGEVPSPPMLVGYGEAATVRPVWVDRQESLLKDETQHVTRYRTHPIVDEAVVELLSVLSLSAKGKAVSCSLGPPHLLSCIANGMMEPDYVTAAVSTLCRCLAAGTTSVLSHLLNWVSIPYVIPDTVRSSLRAAHAHEDAVVLSCHYLNIAGFETINSLVAVQDVHRCVTRAAVPCVVVARAVR